MASKAKFRHEDVARVPKGWKVRTVSHPTGHRVRIAFPPGPRRRGAGQLVSVLHPLGGKNPCPNPCDRNFSRKNLEEFITDSKGRRWAVSLLSSGKDWLAEGYGIKKSRGDYFVGRPVVARGASESEAMDKLTELIDRKNPSGKAKGKGQKAKGKNPPAGQQLAAQSLEAAKEALRAAEKAAAQTQSATKKKNKAKPPKGFQTKLLRKSLHRLLMEAGKGRLEWMARAPDGPYVYRLDGREVTPGQAADALGVKFGAHRTNRGKVPRRRKNRKDRVWIWAENTVLAGQVVRGRFRDFDEEPDSDDYISLDAEQARIWSRSKQPFMRRAGLNALRYLGLPAKNARRKNLDEIEQAQKLYETFQGKDSTGVVDLNEPEDRRDDFAMLGWLISLTIQPRTRDEEIELSFRKDKVRLASNADGTQLYLLGGSQDLNGCLKQFQTDETKDLVELGEIEKVVYLARKAHSNFEPIEWEHTFGENGGIRPFAHYNQLQKRIFLSGGTYKVEAPGIID